MREKKKKNQEISSLAYVWCQTETASSIRRAITVWIIQISKTIGQLQYDKIPATHDKRRRPTHLRACLQHRVSHTPAAYNRDVIVWERELQLKENLVFFGWAIKEKRPHVTALLSCMALVIVCRRFRSALKPGWLPGNLTARLLRGKYTVRKRHKRRKTNTKLRKNEKQKKTKTKK